MLDWVYLNECPGQFSVSIQIMCIYGKEIKNYVKLILKNYVFNMLWFLLIFFVDIITPFTSSTQIACDVMCVHHVIQ